MKEDEKKKRIGKAFESPEAKRTWNRRGGLRNEMMRKGKRRRWEKTQQIALWHESVHVSACLVWLRACFSKSAPLIMRRCELPESVSNQLYKVKSGYQHDHKTNFTKANSAKRIAEWSGARTKRRKQFLNPLSLTASGFPNRIIKHFSALAYFFLKGRGNYH